MQYILRTALLILCFFFFSTNRTSAQFSIGTWRDHLPYGKCIDVCVADSTIYCATPYSVFTYQPHTEEVFRISKSNFLTDVGITAMEYDPTSKYVVIGYENGNVDLVKGNQSTSIPDIKFSSIIGDKGIYDIYPYQNKVYLSTGFGIVVLDMTKLEVKETYFIGENGGPEKVTDVIIHDQIIYAATVTKLRTASVTNAFLANFQNWSPYADMPPSASIAKEIEFFDNDMVLALAGADADSIWVKETGNTSAQWILTNAEDNNRVNDLWSNSEWCIATCSYVTRIYHAHMNYGTPLTDLGGTHASLNAALVWNEEIFAAENSQGLVRFNAFNLEPHLYIKPAGPASADSRRIGAYNNNVWIAHGGVAQDWTNMWKSTGLSGRVNDHWKIVNPDTSGSFSGGGCNTFNNTVADIMDVAIDPLDNNHIIAGSWDDGLLEIDGTNLTGKTINGNGTSGIQLGSIQQNFWPGYRTVGGVAFTREGLLWCTNSYTTKALHARDRNGVFYDYDFEPTILNTDKLTDVQITANGLVWAIVSGRGLLVLNNNKTLSTYSDDSYKLLTDAEGNGKLASNSVLSMEEDLDGELWVGTSSGLSIFYNTDAIFTDENFDSEQILIEQDGNVQILLETEIINAIEIDGSNRKWIGTQNSGVYLFSDDGLQQIYHFTEENSPILGNTVYDIAINHDNGEVFFATEKGVSAFFSTATNFDPDMKNVRVFPNPVRPEYEGNVTIDGLAYNTNVKITDIQGNIIFETESEGGRAVWNGKRWDGSRPATGVYMVYVTTKDGSADDVKKITFIK